MRQAMPSAAADTAFPRLLPLGDTAWTLEFGETLDEYTHARVSGLASLLQALRSGQAAFAAIDDVVPTFRSLTVHYRPDDCDGQALGQHLLRLAQDCAPVHAAGRRWCLPACFEPDFAPDLAAIAEATGSTPAALIEQLTAAEFRVAMIGFMPGFPYMIGLPPALRRPRLASPRAVVPARSIAIAEAMCGVYPWASPGGWNLVGQTPVTMFAAEEAVPALLAAGDRVRWQAVTRTAFLALSDDLRSGRRQRTDFLVQTA